MLPVFSGRFSGMGVSRLLSGGDAVFARAHNGEQVEKTAQVKELPHLPTTPHNTKRLPASSARFAAIAVS